MADNKVKFLRGTSNEYAAAEKDSDTIYFTTDDGKLYIGDKEVSGDGSITIDTTLSDTSTNPVQNKVVKQAIDDKADKSLYGDTTINVGRKAGTIVGHFSTAEGQATTANGLCSHAEGDQTTASGNFSHSEGEQTKAIGAYSHAEGCRTEANGRASHAEGRETTAFGDYSHTSGYYTKALHDNEAAYGKYNESNDNTLFSVGDGTADDARHNAFEITTTGGKLHDKDIATMENISNPNLLTNPDFSINQREISGAFSDTGKYFVDRWRLVSGTVTVNSGGTLTLDGSICQPLENAAGANVTASVSAGTAVYDDTAKTFTITGNGDVISWAKLEIGSAATDFSPPDPATELMKCYRYFYRVGRGIANPNHTSNFNRICYQNISNKIAGTTLQFPVEMRVTPTASVIGTPWCFRLFTNNGVNVVVAGADNVNFNLQKFGYEIVITNDYFAKAVDGFIAPIYTTGYTDFDAEIY